MIIEDENGREWTTEELRDDYREPTDPDPEPLDLDAIDAAYEASLLESRIMGPNTSTALWAVPHLTSELRGYRETEEAWAELPTRTEWTMAGAGTQPDEKSHWYGSADEAERRYGQRGQLWFRTLTIGAPVAISDESPF